MNKKVYKIGLKSYGYNPTTNEGFFYINNKKYKCANYGYIYFIGTTSEFNDLVNLLDNEIKSIEIYEPIYDINDFKEE